LDLSLFELVVWLYIDLFTIHRFVPFTKKEGTYEPLLHSTSAYGHLPYGTKFYREEFLDRNITRIVSTNSTIPNIGQNLVNLVYVCMILNS